MNGAMLFVGEYPATFVGLLWLTAGIVLAAVGLLLPTTPARPFPNPQQRLQCLNYAFVALLVGSVILCFCAMARQANDENRIRHDRHMQELEIRYRR